MKIFRIILIALVILSVNTIAAEKPKGEFFLAAPPKGWILGEKDVQKGIAHFKFVPPGTNVKKWSEMVTITKIAGEQSKPDDFLGRTAEQNEKNCSGYVVQHLAFQSANGYETHGMIESCGSSNTDSKGELLITRAIKGKDYLFIIQKAWKLKSFDATSGFPIPKEKIDESIIYLASAKVCDTTKGTCPTSMGK